MIFAWLLIFLALINSKTAAQSSSITSGWIAGEDTSYFFSEYEVDKATAAVDCSRLGVSLAMITSSSENEFITQHLNDSIRIKRNYWIQGESIVSTTNTNENVFLFDDGQTLSYFHWWIKSGSFRATVNVVKCLIVVQFYSDIELSERQWVEQPCDDVGYFICETEKAVIELEERCGRYKRYNDATSKRISGAIRCGVICDRTAECFGYQVNCDGGCVLLESACTDSDNIPCYDRLCN